jgi:hypothetical protein
MIRVCIEYNVYLCEHALRVENAQRDAILFYLGLAFS